MYFKAPKVILLDFNSRVSVDFKGFRGFPYLRVRKIYGSLSVFFISRVFEEVSRMTSVEFQKSPWGSRKRLVKAEETFQCVSVSFMGVRGIQQSSMGITNSFLMGFMTIQCISEILAPALQSTGVSSDVEVFEIFLGFEEVSGRSRRFQGSFLSGSRFKASQYVRRYIKRNYKGVQEFRWISKQH